MGTTHMTQMRFRAGTAEIPGFGFIYMILEDGETAQEIIERYAEGTLKNPAKIGGPYATQEEARRVSSEILSKGVESLRAAGIVAGRPGDVRLGPHERKS